jgi:hypothetical protein
MRPQVGLLFAYVIGWGNHGPVRDN